MFSLSFHHTRHWRRAQLAAPEVVLPIDLREVEERIPTIDEVGNKRVVICTRTLASFQGPTGIVEMEQGRRHTLPGFGHVYPSGYGEYVVFCDHTKLRADPETGAYCAVPPWTNQLRPARLHAEHAVGPSPPARALGAQARTRRSKLAIVAGLVAASITLAVWTLRPQHDPSPAYSTITPMPRLTAIAVPANELNLAASPATVLHEAQPKQPLKKAPPVTGKVVAGQHNAARVALAIQPWGVIYVNGKMHGVTPPVKELRLKPGRYTVEIRNGEFPPYRQDIDLRIAAKGKMAHDFSKLDSANVEKSGPSLATVSKPEKRFRSQDWPR